jgi:hypothetical protein
MGTQDIRAQTLVRRAEGQVSTGLGAETVILGLPRGVYYGLSGVGPRVWELLEHPTSAEGIVERLVEEYDVEPSRCLDDVLSVLSQLRSEGLVSVLSEDDPK